MHLRGENNQPDSNQSWLLFELPPNTAYLVGGLLAGIATSAVSNSFPIPRWPLTINNVISIGNTFVLTHYCGNNNDEKGALLIGELFGIDVSNIAYPELSTTVLSILDTTLAGLLDNIVEDI
jgi:hypothetical protein